MIEIVTCQKCGVKIHFFNEPPAANPDGPGWVHRGECPRLVAKTEVEFSEPEPEGLRMPETAEEICYVCYKPLGKHAKYTHEGRRMHAQCAIDYQADRILSGTKHDAEKPRWSLMPSSIRFVIRVLEHGARKYSVDNWQAVENPRRRYFDALQRHAWAWFEGETHDPESGEHHLAHAVCCALFLIWFDEQESEK